MSRPTHILRHEHRMIEQSLRALDGMCLTLKTGGVVPAEALTEILDFILNFTDRFHHAREEVFLFPALKQYGVRDEGGPLGFLREQHEMERRLLSELEQAIEDYRNDESEAAGRFIGAARQYSDHLVGHMQQEEAILFRIAEEVVDDSLKTSLIQMFAEPGGNEFMERYEQMAAELEKKWAV